MTSISTGLVYFDIAYNYIYAAIKEHILLQSQCRNSLSS
jgi:hypothetical protein